MIQVCLVDDDPLLLAGVKRTLRRAAPSINLTLANSGAEAVAVLNAQAISVLISDLHMPVMDGHALMTTVQSEFPNVSRVIATGDIDPRRAFELQLVAQRVVAKPVDANTLTALIQELHASPETTGEAQASCPEQWIQWAQLAAWQLEKQQVKKISADVARANPWLAMLLLQATNGGFTSCNHTRDVESAVRALGAAQLSIMFDRLKLLGADARGTAPPQDETHTLGPALDAVLELAREIAAGIARPCLDTLPLQHDAVATLTAEEFAAVIESAVLLRVASIAHPLAGRLHAATTLATNTEAHRDAVLCTALQAARLGVPAAVTAAVCESIGISKGEPVGSGTAGAVLKMAFAQHSDIRFPIGIVS